MNMTRRQTHTTTEAKTRADGGLELRKFGREQTALRDCRWKFERALQVSQLASCQVATGLRNRRTYCTVLCRFTPSFQN